MSTNPISGLTPSFIGAATVLNDSTSTNVLTVALTNGNMMSQGTSEKVDIQITNTLDLAFYFIADGSSEQGKKNIQGDVFELNWALASKANIDGIVPHLFLPGESIDYASLSNQQRRPAGWQINSDTPNINAASLSTLEGWKITPPAEGYVLKAGQSLILVFTNVISALPDGPSLAYMACENKHFVKCGPLQKTPNVISGDKVGIGTTSPKFPLSISSGSTGPKISLWDGGMQGTINGFGISNNQLNYVSGPESDHVFFMGGTNDNGAELFRIKANKEAHVKGKLQVDGNLQVGDDGVASKNFQIKGNLDLGNNLMIEKGNLGIQTKNPLYPLSIQANSVGPKISLWDGGSKDSINGFGISNRQLNYVTGANSDHVFYIGGNNNNGKELMRIKGAGKVEIPGDLQVKGNVDSVIKVVVNYFQVGASNSGIKNNNWRAKFDFGVTFREKPEIIVAICGWSAFGMHTDMKDSSTLAPCVVANFDSGTLTQSSVDVTAEQIGGDFTGMLSLAVTAIGRI